VGVRGRVPLPLALRAWTSKDASPQPRSATRSSSCSLPPRMAAARRGGVCARAAQAQTHTRRRRRGARRAAAQARTQVRAARARRVRGRSTAPQPKQQQQRQRRQAQARSKEGGEEGVLARVASVAARPFTS
jgi:hypothetical protein